jgi:hypothetical protein
MGTKHKEKPIEEKESFKWIQSYRGVCAVQKQCKNNPVTRLVMIAETSEHSCGARRTYATIPAEKISLRQH